MSNILLLILVVAACVIIAGWLVYRFLINLMSKPVLEINLTPIGTAKWSDKKKAADLTDWFLRNGFEPAGLYECWEMPGLIISGFVLPSEQTLGIIYDHPIGGIWIDLCEEYTDGGSLTVSNASTGQSMDHMPQTTKIYLKESPVDELYQKFLSERSKAGRKAVSKEEFASTFEAAYKKEMKWRIDRGGPTSSEVMKVAIETGVLLDGENLQKKTEQVQDIWEKEKRKLGKEKRPALQAVLPTNFQRPEIYRQGLEQKSGPPPQLNLPPLPVYLTLAAAICWWCYYGYQYTRSHAPISFTAILVFFGVFLVFFIPLMWFRAYHRQVRSYPILKRTADSRPGAFLFISGSSSTLLYAREKWIGKVTFIEGSEHQDAVTRLDAVTGHIGGTLIISRKSMFNKVFGSSDMEKFRMPDDDFGRIFTASGTDPAFAGRLIASAIPSAVMGLKEFDKPYIEIDRNLVSVKTGKDLSSPRKEAALNRFLDAAEAVIDEVVQLYI
jgi:hypothetical protein